MGEALPGITVVVPVGPQPEYRQYLDECLMSIRQQMILDDQILVVDDMAHLEYHKVFSFGDERMEKGLQYWNDPMLHLVHNDWLLGCADSWNRGIALAKNENCLMMGSDDKLLPGCLDTCRAMIQRPDYDPLGYYGLSCQLSTGEIVDVFNNAAMVSKSLWKLTGGFPPVAAVGAPDALLISIMIRNLPQHLIQLNKGEPLYWVRSHEAQETGRTGKYWPEIIRIRDQETRDWKEPMWTSHM